MHMHHDHAAATAPINEEDKAICPVMHIPLSKAEATKNGLTRNYQGKTFYLCCETCANQWNKDPEQYARTEE